MDGINKVKNDPEKVLALVEGSLRHSLQHRAKSPNCKVEISIVEKHDPNCSQASGASDSIISDNEGRNDNKNIATGKRGFDSGIPGKSRPQSTFTGVQGKYVSDSITSDYEGRNDNKNIATGKREIDSGIPVKSRPQFAFPGVQGKYVSDSITSDYEERSDNKNIATGKRGIDSGIPVKSTPQSAFPGVQGKYVSDFITSDYEGRNDNKNIATGKRGIDSGIPVKKGPQSAFPRVQDKYDNTELVTNYFVPVRRSPKGMCLNDPSKFGVDKIEIRKSINNAPILSSVGCSSISFVQKIMFPQKTKPKSVLKNVNKAITRSDKNQPTVTVKENLQYGKHVESSPRREKIYQDLEKKHSKNYLDEIRKSQGDFTNQKPYQVFNNRMKEDLDKKPMKLIDSSPFKNSVKGAIKKSLPYSVNAPSPSRKTSSVTFKIEPPTSQIDDTTASGWAQNTVQSLTKVNKSRNERSCKEEIRMEHKRKTHKEENNKTNLVLSYTAPDVKQSSSFIISNNTEAYDKLLLKSATALYDDIEEAEKSKRLQEDTFKLSPKQRDEAIPGNSSVASVVERETGGFRSLLCGCATEPLESKPSRYEPVKCVDLTTTQARLRSSVELREKDSRDMEQYYRNPKDRWDSGRGRWIPVSRTQKKNVYYTHRGFV